MSDIDMGKWSPVWFHTFCTGEEIERIRNPKNAKDFLLRKRADIVADHIRFERVYMNKALVSEDWSFEYVLKNAEIPKDFDMDKIKRLKETANIMCKVLEEDLANNYDLYDMYGSCYLDAPNTKWRGRELKDRVDYY